MLRMKKQFYVVYLLIAFVLFVVIWFGFRVEHMSPDRSIARVSSTPAVQSDGLIPSALNVSQGASEQLNALRARVVNTPEDTVHVFRLARMLYDAHQVEEASRNYRHYLALRPENRQAWLDYTQTLADQKLWSEAEVAAKTMLTHYPGDTAGRYNLGAIYANQSKIEDARTIWSEIVDEGGDATIVAMASSSIERLESFVKPGWVAAK